MNLLLAPLLFSHGSPQGLAVDTKPITSHFSETRSGHCNSALLSSFMMEDIICFPRLLMLLSPACLLALGQSGSHGALSQSHRGDVEKYWGRAKDKTRGEEQAAKGTGFASCHCILLQRGSRIATSPFSCAMGTGVPASAA